jgi:hypothetical protein
MVGSRCLVAGLVWGLAVTATVRAQSDPSHGEGEPAIAAGLLLRRCPELDRPASRGTPARAYCLPTTGPDSAQAWVLYCESSPDDVRVKITASPVPGSGAARTEDGRTPFGMGPFGGALVFTAVVYSSAVDYTAHVTVTSARLASGPFETDRRQLLKTLKYRGRTSDDAALFSSGEFNVNSLTLRRSVE